ncbi:hypothetical protein [Endothiovibrio diazotrophicus]
MTDSPRQLHLTTFFRGRRFRRGAALSLLAGLLLAGCSGPTEDVRLTLCTGLVAELLAGDAEPHWRGSDAVTKGYDDLEMRLNFAPEEGQKGETASCFYPYEARDEDARILADPLSAYATYPSWMVFRGQTLAGESLLPQVNAVLKKQGREGLERLREGEKSVH